MGLREAVHARAIELGKDVLRMTTAAGSGHPSSALSIMHIVITLTHHVMRHDPADPWNPECDRLVLSEGHAVPAVYAAWADLGGAVGPSPEQAKRLTSADLARLREVDSPLDGHPNPAEGFPFFDAATGSLGQGLSVGAGLGLAARLRGIDRRIYVIIGDGESREGQIWEAMDFIADHGLTSVVALFNCNGQGQADYVSTQQSPEAIAAKAQAFGWETRAVDGHDAEAISAALAATGARQRPLAVIARTQKGWGCGLLKDKSSHGKPLAANQLEQGLAELDAMYGVLRIERGTAMPARPPFRKGDRTTREARVAMSAAAGVGGTASRGVSRPAAAGSMPSFVDAMAAAGLSAALEKNSIATRRAYGAALVAMGGVDERVVVLDGDVRNSTFSEMFIAKFPHRFFECKIAEQNMVSTAVGLAAAGFVPFASSFAKFIARAYDQIEMAQIGRANIKLCGSHAGVSLAADGPSQMSLHDVAYFRSATAAESGRGGPVCIVFHPSDAVAAYHCTALMAGHVGMCYMRTHRPDVPVLYRPETMFEIGGSHVLAEGSAATIVSAGYMVHVCRRAVDLLAASGVQVTLIDAYSFPLNCAPILDAGVRSGGTILCVEDNYPGGLAGAVAEAAARTGGVRVESMTCRRIPRSAKTTDEIMHYVGLSAKHIAGQVQAMLR